MAAEHSDSHGHDHAHDDGAVHAHISKMGFLVAIFLCLIVLTFITVKASYYDFGSANTAIAIAIATVKASLVATFFMHLKYDKGFHSLIFVMAFVFLGVMLFFCLDDIETRGRVDVDNMVRIQERTGLQAPGGFVQFVDDAGAGHGEHAGQTGGHNSAAPSTAAHGAEHH
jgi:cytochrome c oxidase subunit 4